MVHLHARIVRLLLAALMALSLSACATSNRQDPLFKSEMALASDEQAFQKKVQDYNARAKANGELKEQLMAKMSNKQLAALAAAGKTAPGSPANVLANRKFGAAMASNLSLSAAFNQWIENTAALNKEMNSLLDEQKNLRQRAESLLTLNGMRRQARARQRAAAQAFMNSYIQQQNQQAIISGLQNIQTTIQNQSSSGRTVVVPQN